jgi:hypothetical protein
MQYREMIMSVSIELSDEDIALVHQVCNEFNNLPYGFKTHPQIELLQLLADKIHQAERPDLYPKNKQEN